MRCSGTEAPEHSLPFPFCWVVVEQKAVQHLSTHCLLSISFLFDSCFCLLQVVDQARVWGHAPIIWYNSSSVTSASPPARWYRKSSSVTTPPPPPYKSSSVTSSVTSSPSPSTSAAPQSASSSPYGMGNVECLGGAQVCVCVCVCVRACVRVGGCERSFMPIATNIYQFPKPYTSHPTP